MTFILIYQDYVHNNGSLWKALAAHYGVGQVAFADADDIKNGILSSDIKAFFMPGGASRYVADKLDGAGNQQIKNYVAKGGLYIGICAGAYYASRRTEWYPGFDQMFSLDNELGFFPGIAQGPVPQFISKANSQHMTLPISITGDDGSIIHCLYWAGPAFKPDAGRESDFQVLARYTDLPDQPAAIVSGSHGQGRYLLIGPHLEIDATQIAMMQFGVVDNAYASLLGISKNDGMTCQSFINLINEHINKND